MYFLLRVIMFAVADNWFKFACPMNDLIFFMGFQIVPTNDLLLRQQTQQIGDLNCGCCHSRKGTYVVSLNRLEIYPLSPNISAVSKYICCLQKISAVSKKYLLSPILHLLSPTSNLLSPKISTVSILISAVSNLVSLVSINICCLHPHIFCLQTRVSCLHKYLLSPKICSAPEISLKFAIFIRISTQDFLQLRLSCVGPIPFTSHVHPDSDQSSPLIPGFTRNIQSSIHQSQSSLGRSPNKFALPHLTTQNPNSPHS